MLSDADIIELCEFQVQITPDSSDIELIRERIFEGDVIEDAINQIMIYSHQ